MSDKFKKLRYGGLSVAVTAVVVAIVVLLNVLIETVMKNFDVQIDLSENKIFSIEDGTIEYLKKLDDTIFIKFAASEESFAANKDTNQINEIAKKFESESSLIELSYIDMLKNPTFKSEYGGELTSVDIVVESRATGRYKVIKYEHYLNIVYYDENGNKIDYDTAAMYSQFGMSIYTDVSYAAEQAILSAIMQVINMSPTRVAFATGFGEGEILGNEGKVYQDFVELLENNAYLIETVDVNLVDEIDPELDYLIVFHPSADYTTEAMSKVSVWLDNKGEYGKNLFYIPSSEYLNTPVLDAFTNEWGVNVEKGLVYQTDTEYSNPQNQLMQYVKIINNKFSSSSQNSDMMSYGTRPITTLFEEKGAYITTPLITTYDGAVIMPFDADEEWVPDNSKRAVHNIAVECLKERYEELTQFASRVFVFGDPISFTSYGLAVERYGTSEFYMSIFDTLSGREEGVLIKPKSYNMTTFEITAAESNRIALAFCVVLPLAIIALGIVMFVRRRFK